MNLTDAQLIEFLKRTLANVMDSKAATDYLKKRINGRKTAEIPEYEILDIVAEALRIYNNENKR
jgi:hypothetical protein